MENRIQNKKKLSSFQMIILGFGGVILLGALLLMLPVSSADGVFTPFSDTLFTATSAVCVTGLVVKDTASYWSVFGQMIILILIQIGGMGVITVAASIAMLSGRKISLLQRSTMQEAIAAPQVGGIVRLTGFVIRLTLLFEGMGAVLMMPAFCMEYGPKGIWLSIFHSVSAFCNAGFDLMGTKEAPFVSLTALAGNPWINFVLILLIVIGGIGFLTWDDIRTHKMHIKRYHMQSKVILTTTAVLIAIPAIYFFAFEFQEMPFWERLCCAIFQAVTPRTAGFNTADLAAMSGIGQSIIVILMLIGGSPGSTAGGMKTTTAAVLFANAIAVFRKKEDANFFGRRVEEGVIKTAATILMMYMMLFLSGAFIISFVEGLPIGLCIFEAASAVGTAGLTLGITSGLGGISRCVLIILMFMGRVGGLNIIYATLKRGVKVNSKLPQEKIMIG